MNGNQIFYTYMRILCIDIREVPAFSLHAYTITRKWHHGHFNRVFRIIV